MRWFCRRGRDELGADGSVLVLTLFIVGALLLFVALVIDTARLASANREKKDTAENAALAALNKYLDPANVTHDTKYVAAVTAAENIAGLNFLTSRFDEAHAASGEITSGAAGTLTSGRWWIAKPTTCTFATCPCNLPADDDEIKGCFQACPDSGGCSHPDGVSSALFANAMKVTLRTKSGQGVRNYFATFSSQSETAVSSSGIAAIVPRHTVYLVDLSRSTTTERHLKQEESPSPNTPAEYAYRVTSTTCPGDNSNPCLSAGSCTISSGDLPFDVDAQYEGLTETRSGSPPLTTHFRNDYNCYTIGSEHYLVDSYTEPEPLATILDSVNAALTRWEQYAVLGDLIGTIGYDEAALASRKYSLMATSAANFTLLKNITSSATTRKQNFFFPRDVAYSDLPEALDEARTMLQADPLYTNSSNSVVLFSNGLVSCNNVETGSNLCNGTFSTHRWGLSEALHNKVSGSAANRYQAEGITLHVVLVGADVTPHTVMIKSKDDGTKCMSDAEMRRRNYLNLLPDTSANDQTKYEAVGNGTAQNYVLAHYYLYDAARTVGGTFLGVRAACGGSCPKTSAMNTSCSTVATSPHNNPPASLGDPADTEDYVIVDGTLGIQDGSGRVTCDTLCNTKRNQVLAAFATLYEKPPITLVEDITRATVTTTTTSTSTT